MDGYELSAGGRGNGCWACGKGRGKSLRVLAWMSGRGWCYVPRRGLACREGIGVLLNSGSFKWEHRSGGHLDGFRSGNEPDPTGREKKGKRELLWAEPGV